MNRPTLGQLRNSSLPQAIGVCADNISEICRTVNEAQERLLQDPMAPDEGWWCGFARYLFNVSTANPYIITPREVARIIAMDVCRKPVKLRNSFYEFLDFGEGFQPTNCECNTWNCKTLQAFERETVPTLTDLSGTSYIRVYISDSRDVGKALLIQGADNNGITVISTDSDTGNDILGEYVVTESPFAVSASQFSTITGFIKDLSYGPFTIMQVDAAGTELPLSVMQPSEGIAAYRKYYLNGLPSKCCDTTTGIIQVQAQCKLDMIPARSDTDYLMIPSIPALIEEVQFIRQSRMDDPNAQKMADRHHERALSILFGQHDHYYGKQTASITVPLFGSNRVMPTFQ